MDNIEGDWKITCSSLIFKTIAQIAWKCCDHFKSSETLTSSSLNVMTLWMMTHCFHSAFTIS